MNRPKVKIWLLGNISRPGVFLDGPKPYSNFLKEDSPERKRGNGAWAETN